MNRSIIVLLSGVLLSCYSAQAEMDAEAYAVRLFDRITGSAINIDDPRLQAISNLVRSNHKHEALELATSDPQFLDLTVRQWIAPSSNYDASTRVEFNDFIAMVMGVVRDDLDARILLTGDFQYVGRSEFRLPAPSLSNNDHFRMLEALPGSLSEKLVIQNGQWPGSQIEPAGLLTSRAWAKAHYTAGTNRRALQMSFQEFLCKPIVSLADTLVPDERVRRDVNRHPGGLYSTYRNRCVGCHAGMDALGGAFARFDFRDNQIIYYTGDQVAPKMNQNSQNYPAGRRTVDDAWVNLWTERQNSTIGWQGAMRGTGVRSFGEMLSNTDAFASCMAKRVFEYMCRRPMGRTDRPLVQDVAQTFVQSGYKLKRVFEEVALLPQCIEIPQTQGGAL